MSELIKFIAVGGFAALVNVVCRILLGGLMPFEVAVVLAYILGMATAYLLNRELVFKDAGAIKTSQIARFTLVNLLALVLVWAVSVGLLRFLFPWIGFSWHAETIAHAIGVASPVLSSYFLHRHYTFQA